MGLFRADSHINSEVEKTSLEIILDSELTPLTLYKCNWDFLPPVEFQITVKDWSRIVRKGKYGDIAAYILTSIQKSNRKKIEKKITVALEVYDLEDDRVVPLHLSRSQFFEFIKDGVLIETNKTEDYTKAALKGLNVRRK